MIILGIETSCDETAAAVLANDDKRIMILSNVVASSVSLQAKYGGVIPEQAAREQIKSIIPAIEETLTQAFPGVIPANAGIQLTSSSSKMDPRLRGDDRIKKIDAIAVTFGPGLIGSLLVGVETAKTLSLVWQKPLIPVNHLIGHFYANWINESVPRFPCLGLLVSGGHTDLVLFKDHGKYKYLGGTRDDAAGECFDKCARLLGLPYPGGPEIAKLAQKGNPTAFNLPRPMMDSDDFDFSFSGLKTSVSNIVYGISEKQNNKRLTINDKRNLSASIEAAIVDVLVEKTIKAVKLYHVDQIMIAGGVAANQKLIQNFKFQISNFKLKTKLFVPPPELCTDNAAMIAAAAFFNYQPIDPLALRVNPSLSLNSL